MNAHSTYYLVSFKTLHIQRRVLSRCLPHPACHPERRTQSVVEAPKGSPQARSSRSLDRDASEIRPSQTTVALRHKCLGFRQAQDDGLDAAFYQKSKGQIPVPFGIRGRTYCKALNETRHYGDNFLFHQHRVPKLYGI